MAAQEILVAASGIVPALILHKGHVRPQVHRHGRAADRAVRDEFAGDLSYSLCSASIFLTTVFVVIGLLMAGLGTLPQAVIALCIEQPAACQIRPSESNDPHWWSAQNSPCPRTSCKSSLINRLRRVHIAVDIDIPAPIRPVFFQGCQRDRSRRNTYRGNRTFAIKSPKYFCKAFAGIGKAGGGGKSGTGADHNRIRRFQFLFEPVVSVSQQAFVDFIVAVLENIEDHLDLVWIFPLPLL